jgi:flavin-dependent dehydrogenase
MNIGIIGGGLAGLTTGISLLLEGYSCTIFEKNSIPTLKVCGEYLSLEVLPLIEKLGIKIEFLNLPFIDRLTCQVGSTVNCIQLPLGGVGISRQLIDELFKNRFVELGGILNERCTVSDNSNNKISLKDGTTNFQFDQVINASGRLNPFVIKKQRQELYAAYKKQIHTTLWKRDQIHLHFFNWGYFGISQIENNRVCICLMIKHDLLKNVKSFEQVSTEIRETNPFISDLLLGKGKTVAISNFTFFEYSTDQEYTVGDALGAIPPIVGNGMSLAIYTGYDQAMQISKNKRKEVTRYNLRIRTGLLLNKLSMSKLAHVIIRNLLRNIFLSHTLIMKTHGKPH